MASPIPFAPVSTAWADAGGAAATVAAPAGRTVLVAGATGLVGREILQGLLADDTVTAVHALGRRPPPDPHPKLTFHRIDFQAISTGSGQAASAISEPTLSTLPRADEAFLALGTTIGVAGGKEAFRAIDFDAVLAVAKAAKVAGVTRLGVVSAMGASARSRLFYNRVKGEMEDALSALGFDTLVIARPSFLAGDRERLGQPRRPGEQLALQISRWFAPLVPDNFKSIQAGAVAASLLHAVRLRSGRHVIESSELRRADRPSAMR